MAWGMFWKLSHIKGLTSGGNKNKNRRHRGYDGPTNEDDSDSGSNVFKWYK